MKFGRISLTLLSLFILVASSACGADRTAQPEDNKTEEKPVANSQPVTLTMYNWGTNFNDDEFQKLIVEPVQKKYPHITINQIKRGPGTGPQDIAVNGTQIDFIATNNDTLGEFQRLGYLYDISSDIKKEKIDLNRFTKEGLDRGKLIDGQLVGLPLNIYPVALFYNKDIFDRFGVAYPKDGLTWDEVIELAKILTRNENGQQYRGFDPQVVYALASSLPIDILDPRTDKASVLNDQWRMVLDVYKKIVTIPGNTPKGTTFAQLVEGFLKDKNVAMHASNMFVQMEEATKNGFNWDIAQYPQYKGYPNIGGGGQSNIVAVSKTSKHKEEVMKVIGVMLSDEVQLLGASRYARLSALKDQKFKDAYGKDVPYLKGKNIQSLFKSRPGEYANYSPLAGTRDVRAIFEQKVKEFVSGQKDFNTAMREAEEEMNKKVAELKGK